MKSEKVVANPEDCALVVVDMQPVDATNRADQMLTAMMRWYG
jgi:hypothetical protein